MKITILIFLSIINTFIWFENSIEIGSFFYLMPLVSVISSLIVISPSFYRKGVQIKLIYLVILGILYFNIPLYITSLIDKTEIYNSLAMYNISERYFIKANILLGISFPLLIVGYKSRMAGGLQILLFSKFQGLTLNINLNVFLILFSVFLYISINITGLVFGSTYDGFSSYYYILLFRTCTIICCYLIYNIVISRKFSQIPTNHFFSKSNFPSISALTIFLFYVLIGGDRGPALVIILILGYGYLLVNEMKVKYSNLIVLFLLLLIVTSIFSFVEVVRMVEVEKFSFNAIQENWSNFQNYENKAGLTIKTTSLAIEGIEQGLYPHSYGFFTLQSLIKGIPYIGTLIMDNLFGDITIFGTAELITIQNSGENYNSGLGTSYLADTFIEFGLIGVIFLSLTYGVIIKIFDIQSLKISNYNFTSFLLVSLFVGYSVYIGRGTLFGFLVNFIHTLILLYIILGFSRLLKLK